MQENWRILRIRGQWIIAVFGILLGIPMMMGASRIISTGMASEVFMIPDFVDASSLLIAVALMGAAFYISLRIIQRKWKKIVSMEILREGERKQGVFYVGRGRAPGKGRNWRLWMMRSIKEDIADQIVLLQKEKDSLYNQNYRSGLEISMRQQQLIDAISMAYHEYTILKAVMLENGLGFALGEHPQHGGLYAEDGPLRLCTPD